MDCEKSDWKGKGKMNLFTQGERNHFTKQFTEDRHSDVYI